MSRDDLEKIYLTACVSEEFREEMEHLVRIEDGALIIPCIHRHIRFWQSEILRVVNANPERFAIREVVYFSEFGAFCYSVEEVAN